MATPVIAKTSTPDATLGNPISMVTVDQGAGAADQQVISIADPTTAGRFAAITAGGAQVVDGSGVTQPISAASLPLPTGALADATFTGRINTQGQKAMDASTPVVLASDQSSIPVTQSGPFVLAAGTNRIGSVRVVDSADADQTAVKGTQTSRFLGVQDAKDSGRTYVVLHAELITGVTTEALATFTKNVNGTETTGQTAYTITNGKTFRIQAITYEVINTTTTANRGRIKVRVAATVSATSPIIATCAAAAQVAVAASGNFGFVDFPDGIEIKGNGSIQIGISHLESVTTAGIASFSLVGYEY